MRGIFERMNNFLFSAILFLACSNSFAQANRIDSIAFPYIPAYHFSQGGVTISYNESGKEIERVNKEIRYEVLSLEPETGTRVFVIQTQRDTGATEAFNSNLQIDSKGMRWWDHDTRGKVPAIKLPLYA